MQIHNPTLVRPPRQERSQVTLNRILDATESLLRDRLMEEITLAEVLSRSGVSVGAFYARFRNKDALVSCLYDRYDRRLGEATARVLERSRWRDHTLSDRVRVLIRYVAMQYRRHRGLLRALILHARAQPGAINAEQHRHRQRFYDDVTRFLLECRSEISHPDPEAAVRLGLLMAGAAMRDKILHGDAPQPRSVIASDSWLAREVTRALLSYLSAARSES